MARVFENYNRRISTGILNDVISKALLMKEPPVVSNRRLKVYYVTQTGVRPPTFIFFVNDPALLHFSYMRYLENQLRASFDFEGTGIKMEFRERKES
ncbi:GTPase Der [bioreactor metagenome]|uniref:GTPase Der n=1 Tax=bioreactor metagenome TaxID=1076179 RepID=A0A645FJW8_9ZZZZ